MKKHPKNKKENAVIAKVFQNKRSGQKFATIPARSEIEAGDYVQIIKLVVTA